MIDANKTGVENYQKVLVFLHYFGGSRRSWKWVIDVLKADYQCIALNLPGFGNSTPLKEPSIESLADYCRKELDQLEITNYTLIGHSMGAKIALQMASDALERNIGQLILIAPSPPGIEPIEDAEKERMLKHPNLEEALTTVKNITKIPLSEAQQNLAIEDNLIADETTWFWWLNDGMNYSLKDLTKVLKMPISILNSENDPVITPEIINERVINVLPKSELVTTKNSGHLIPMENPSWLAEQIKKIVEYAS